MKGFTKMRKKQFPRDLENAFNMGARLGDGEWK